MKGIILISTLLLSFLSLSQTNDDIIATSEDQSSSLVHKCDRYASNYEGIEDDADTIIRKGKRSSRKYRRRRRGPRPGSRRYMRKRERFRKQHPPMKKPVIYLYPTTELEVEVLLDIKGEVLFTYPIYDSGWRFTAEPDGTLHFGEATFNYLFWEGIPEARKLSNVEKDGFVVEGSQTIPFLKEKLSLAGLNTKEQADFITFWGPQMSQNEANYVHFEFNETCNRYAELNITPQPDNFYRIYMIWYAVDPNLVVKEQEIIPLQREGFTVIEWGGQELSTYKPENKNVQ